MVLVSYPLKLLLCYCGLKSFNVLMLLQFSFPGQSLSTVLSPFYPFTSDLSHYQVCSCAVFVIFYSLYLVLDFVVGFFFFVVFLSILFYSSWMYRILKKSKTSATNPKSLNILGAETGSHSSCFPLRFQMQ